METTEFLPEFKEALEQEIATIKRGASSGAVPLASGKLISQKTSSYQYSFRVDTIINSPSGNPCELDLPRRRNIPATIVQIEHI